MRKALILAALICSAGCSLHMSAELLNPLNKGGKTSPAASAPTPTPTIPLWWTTAYTCGVSPCVPAPTPEAR